MNKPKLHTVDADGNGITPVTVGNPGAASSMAIDQSHLEEFAAGGSDTTVVECQRPPKAIFFTVRSETDNKPWKDRGFFYLLQMEGRDPYIVDPEIAKQKQEEEDTIRPILIVRYVTMAGEEGLWPIKIDPADGKGNAWNKSARGILEIAESGKWVRIVSLKKHYRHQVSRKTLEEVPPRFTDRTFDALINIAFPQDRIVGTLDHEIWDVLKNGSTK